jgi:2-dehydro-3-deoxyglucarate aldolase
MRDILIKQQISQGKLCIGGWLTTASPAVAEAMATLPFSWIAIDMEHSAIPMDQVQSSFIAIEHHGCAPLVRMLEADPIAARRFLDMGAQGLIIPAVESAEKLKDFIQHCIYPPKGKRGVGLSRCNIWGDTFDEYYQNFNPVIIPQIETANGVSESSKIAALEEVDGLFLGPYDLSANLGEPGIYETADFKSAVEETKAACLKNQKSLGIHQVETSIDQLNNRIAEGYKFIAYGTDMIAMRTSLDMSKINK